MGSSRWPVLSNVYNSPPRSFPKQMRNKSHTVDYTTLGSLERGWDVLVGLKMDKTQSHFFRILKHLLIMHVTGQFRCIVAPV